jgi:Protein of unknown function (DUF418)/Heparan-alpha-glucosaminide N-acetyltransferase, catalytic
MLFAHFGSAAVQGAGWQNNVVKFTDGRAMPLFVMLSGCGVTFLLARSKRPWREMLGRAALLLVLGLAIDSTQPIAVILHFYAAFFLLAVLANRLPTRWLLPAAGAFVAIGAVTSMYLMRHLPNPIEHVAANAQHWGSLNLLFKPHVLFADLLVTGVYPVFPSFAFVLVGMWIARQDLSSRRLRLGLVAVGLGLAAIGYGSGFATKSHRTDPNASPIAQLAATAKEAGVELEVFVESQARSAGKTPDEVIALTAAQLEVEPDQFVAEFKAASAAVPAPDGWDLLDQAGHSNKPAWMIGATGFAALVIGLSLLVADRLRRLTAPLVALGKIALTVYVGHLLLFRWPMKNWPWGFSTNQGFLLVLAGFAAAAGFACLWMRRFTHGPLEAALRLAGRAIPGGSTAL